jgi:hypothetical protein
MQISWVELACFKAWESTFHFVFDEKREMQFFNGQGSEGRFGFSLKSNSV